MFTFQDLMAKIYSFSKKAIWLLEIRQNWCIGQFYNFNVVLLEVALPVVFRKH